MPHTVPSEPTETWESKPGICCHWAAPVPVKLTLCVLPATTLLSSVTVSAPVRVPVASGVKVTLMVQLESAPTPLPQLFVSEKSPLAVMLEICSQAHPVLFRVTASEALVVPTN